LKTLKTQHSQHSENQEIFGNRKNKAQIKRNQCQKIDNSEKTENIIPFIFNTAILEKYSAEKNMEIIHSIIMNV
jgi:hypothetical protein